MTTLEVRRSRPDDPAKLRIDPRRARGIRPLVQMRRLKSPDRDPASAVRNDAPQSEISSCKVRFRSNDPTILERDHHRRRRDFQKLSELRWKNPVVSV